MSVCKEFGFGLETEYILVDRDFRPLWVHDLDHCELLALIDSVPNSDVSTTGFNIKPLHTRAGHYLLEGYTLTDKEFNPLMVMPKGIEIRTPVVSSYDQCIKDSALLRQRLDARLAREGMATAILSHHPLHTQLDAPPNYDRYDYWQWALTATSTYGPDCNISVPDDILHAIDRQKFHARMNHYLPALIALSLDSPLANGGFWTVNGRVGKSLRTHRRRMFAPLYYVHDRDGTWFEFKGFEMCRNSEDYLGYFLLCLTLLLDDQLEGNTSDDERIEQLGEIAVDGIASNTIKERIKLVLERADKMAQRFGFTNSGLERLWRRVETTSLPADEVITAFKNSGSVEKTLQALSNSTEPAGTIVTVRPQLSLRCS